MDEALRLLNPPHLSYRPVTLLDNGNNNKQHFHSNNQNKQSPSGMRSPPVVTVLSYKAVKDYDPRSFSRSAHPRLELTFREGDVLKPLGKNSHFNNYIFGC